MNEKFEHLLLRAEQLITRIESALPQALSPPDWTASWPFAIASEVRAMAGWSPCVMWAACAWLI
jgi:hypothetical protein